MFCRTCLTKRRISKYHKDNPILSCGHIRERKPSDDYLHKIKQELDKMFQDRSSKYGISEVQLRRECIKGLLEVCHG